MAELTHGRLLADAPAGPRRLHRWLPWLRVEWLVLLTAGVYLNSFAVPFLFDDLALTENATLRQWWRVRSLFHPPADTTLAGRPIANVSFAINHALLGGSPASYHLGNLLIHLAAAVTLMALVGRVLRLPRFNGRYQQSGPWIAFAAACVWSVNPANVTAVSYLVQRTESLVSLFYLLTLYGFVRGCTSPRPTAWWTVAVGACLLGMGTKEVMIAAPLVVLLFDRAFIAPSWQAVLRRRWPVHVALVLTAGWLIYLAAGDPRGASAGFDTANVSWSQYAVIQATWWPKYFIEAVWPTWLCFDHGPVTAARASQAAERFFPWLALVMMAVVACLIYLGVRRPRVGWVMLGAVMVLAPSSSVVPVATEMLADHRGYLTRAATTVLLWLWLDAVVPATWRRSAVLVAAAGMVCIFSVMTVQRNARLADPVALWTHVAAAYPDNARAYVNLARAMIDRPDADDATLHEAIDLLEHARTLASPDARVINNLGLAHARLGAYERAVAVYDEALAVNPQQAVVLNNRGAALRQLGRDDEALADFEAALRASPGYRRAIYNRAMLLLDRGELARSRAQLTQLAHDWPDYAPAHYGVGRCAELRGDDTAAVAAYDRALAIAPQWSAALTRRTACAARLEASR